MRITKRQLKTIVLEHMLKEMANETINLGGEEWSRDDLLGAISDYSKELTGRRDRGAIERLASAPLEDIAAYYEDMFDSDEAQQFVYATDVRAAESQRNVDNARDAYKPMPKQQGMGHRPAGSKSQRRMESRSVLKNKLRKIIRGS